VAPGGAGACCRDGAAGDILPELLAWLRERRLFKLFVPKEFGGLEFTLTAAVRLYEELAALDGSLGWLVQIGAGGGFFVPSFPPEVARELFAPPEAVIAGTSYVGGRARRLPKGFCVRGYWRYASGAAYATLFTAQAEVEGEGIAAFAFRREEVTLIPEWEPLGMRRHRAGALRFGSLWCRRSAAFGLGSACGSQG
jgi:alkylation response protein AidB-like acyl-CoA dehydrogenase